MEWQRYRLIIAAIALVAMGGLAYYAISRGSGDSSVDEEEEESSLSLPEIEPDEVTFLEFKRPDDEEPTRLERSGENWRVTSPVESAASSTNIETALTRLSELEANGIAARTDTHHERLQVDEEHAIHVVARAGSEEVINMWVGARRSGNSMVRLNGQDTVLTVEGAIQSAFSRPLRDWRDKTLTDLDRDEVREILYVSANGVFHFRKPNDDWQQVSEPAEGDPTPTAIEERFAPSRVGSAVNALVSLRAADFAAADMTLEQAGLSDREAIEADGEEGEAQPATPAARVSISTGTGNERSTIHLRLGNQVADDDERRYLQIEGNDTIFIVSRFIAERLRPESSSFQEPEEGEEDEEEGEGAPPAMPPGMPPGGPHGGGGANQLPPEVMEQLRRQMQQQQQH